ncbi:MAG: hypothetical protein KIH01_08775 [Candidatus Freyarchaeota archaeon]|nr:hypothetical protein [Candidatus Jordarchaeia archaeon]
MAKYVSAPALFAARERELVEEIEREPFDVNVMFLEDLLSASWLFISKCLESTGFWATWFLVGLRGSCGSGLRLLTISS